MFIMVNKILSIECVTRTFPPITNIWT